MKTIILKLEGLHCSSCAINIDLTLEDLNGVQNSDTSYHQSTTTITYDENKISLDQITNTIKSLGYLPLISAR